MPLIYKNSNCRLILAFPIRVEFGEEDYLTNYYKPHPDIIKTLENHTNCMEMYQMGLPEELLDEKKTIYKTR